MSDSQLRRYVVVDTEGRAYGVAFEADSWPEAAGEAASRGFTVTGSAAVPGEPVTLILVEPREQRGELLNAVSPPGAAGPALRSARATAGRLLRGALGGITPLNCGTAGLTALAITAIAIPPARQWYWFPLLFGAGMGGHVLWGLVRTAWTRGDDGERDKRD